MNDELKQRIIEHNNRFPVDRWWRKKYNIPYNSDAHREIRFIDQLWDFLEDQIFDELLSQDVYEINSGDYVKKKVFANKEDEMNDFLNEAKSEIEEFKKLKAENYAE